MNNLTRTDSQWSEYIGESMQKSVDAILETAERIYEFKLDSESVSGGSDFTTRAKSVLGMSPSVSKRWSNIGANSSQLARARATLPTSQGAIDELLSVDDWQGRLESGEIAPQPSRDELRAIKKADKAAQSDSVEEEPVKKPKVEVSPNIEDIFNQIDGMSYADMGTVFDYILEHAIKAGKEGGKAGDDLVGHISRETAMALRAYYNNTIHIKL